MLKRSKERESERKKSGSDKTYLHWDTAGLLRTVRRLCLDLVVIHGLWMRVKTTFFLLSNLGGGVVLSPVGLEEVRSVGIAVASIEDDGVFMILDL